LQNWTKKHIYENPGVKNGSGLTGFAQYDSTNKYFILSQGIDEIQIGKVGLI
jgi:hypothetical protein